MLVFNYVSRVVQPPSASTAAPPTSAVPLMPVQTPQQTVSASPHSSFGTSSAAIGGISAGGGAPASVSLTGGPTAQQAAGSPLVRSIAQGPHVLS